jgi:hypothetical protein
MQVILMLDAGYSNTFYNLVRYAFIGQPVVKFDIDPVLGKSNPFSINIIPKVRLKLVF